jgi:dTDP-4-dehydrorhamnose reductase
MAALGNAAVLGGRGMLGVDLVEACRKADAFAEVLAADLPEVDITDERSLRRALSGLKPAVIFNCAAMTDVDGCESKRDLAFALNATAAGLVADAAASVGALLIHVSTDFVFDGRKGALYAEDDPPAPLSVYGLSKLAGERLVAERAGKWIVARTAWLYGRTRMNFVDRMLQLGSKKEELSVVTDQVGSPTWTRDLAAALIALARSGETGIFHAANSGACSRYEQVKLMFECAGLRTRLRPVDSSAFPRVAAVPACSPLSVEKLRLRTSHIMRPWAEALSQYVRTESAIAAGRGTIQ